MQSALPAGAVADDYAANDPALTEPPPSYNEAVAWTPPVHLDTAHSLVLARDIKPNSPGKKLRPRSSIEVSSAPGPSTAAPTARHSHYDGLTKQRTRPLSTVTTSEQVLPLPRATLSRQNSQRLKAAASSSVQTTVTARTPRSTPSKRPAPRETSSAPPATVPAAMPVVSLPAAALSAADVSSSAPPEKPKRRPLPPIPTDPAAESSQQSELSAFHPSLTELDVLIARIELEPDYNVSGSGLHTASSTYPCTGPDPIKRFSWQRQTRRYNRGAGLARGHRRGPAPPCDGRWSRQAEARSHGHVRRALRRMSRPVPCRRPSGLDPTLRTRRALGLCPQVDRAERNVSPVPPLAGLATARVDFLNVSFVIRISVLFPHLYWTLAHTHFLHIDWICTPTCIHVLTELNVWVLPLGKNSSLTPNVYPRQ